MSGSSLALIALVLYTLTLAAPARAQQTIPLAGDRRVPAQGQTEFTFDLAAVGAGQQVRLGLDARIEWGGLGGSTGALIAEVNAQGLMGRHLINKPLMFAMRNDCELAWGAADSHGYRILYSADFSDLVKTDESYEYGVPDTDPYRFVWDITSYVKPGSNTVTISAVQGMALALALRNVVVEVGAPLPPLPQAARLGQATARASGALPVYVPSPAAPPVPAAELSPSGTLRLKVGARQFTIVSRTSLPEGKWNERGASGPWTRVRPGTTGSARWAADAYTVERRVTLHPGRIAVADTITNSGGGLLGVMVEHRLQSAEPPARKYLGGYLVKNLKQRDSPAHPTALAEYSDVAAGLVAEDDILRIHSQVFAEDRGVGLADRQLGFGPGASHTLEWSIYALPGGDYWAFVNAIRRDWGVNATLRGPSRWVHPSGIPTTADAAREWLSQTRMVVLCNPMFGTKEEAEQRIYIQHGTALSLCRAWCDLSASLVPVLKAASPQTETFVYTHQNLCTEPGHESKYPDSRALDTEGKVATTVYTPSPSLFVPTLSNSYGQALRAVDEMVAERIGANVYIDEITASNVPGFGAYQEWDGCTVDIDRASHAVTRKLSSAILLMQPWRESLMAHLKSQGKTVIANGPFHTRTMMRWGLQCFVESTVGDTAPVAAHLSHPLVLAEYSNPDVRVQTEVLRRSLDHAGISFAGFAVAAPVFPITPLELHPGVIIGQERILTNRSGQFGWGDGSRAEVIVLDAEGRRAATPLVREVRRGKAVLTQLRLPKDGLAVLVRQTH